MGEKKLVQVGIECNLVSIMSALMRIDVTANGDSTGNLCQFPTNNAMKSSVIIFLAMLLLKKSSKLHNETGTGQSAADNR